MNIIFVTGCPRSGTSLFCGVLDKCGAKGGEICGATNANPKGQYENTHIRNQIIKPYLRSIDADPMGQQPLPDETLFTDGFPPYPNLRTKVINALVTQGVGQDDTVYLKVCKAVLMWPVFAHAFPDAQWVIVRRNSEDIVRSCTRTSFMRKRNSKDEWMDWVEYHVRRFSELTSAKPDQTHVVWPSNLVEGNFTSIRTIVENLGLIWNEDAIVDWVDKKLWHGK